MIYTVLRDRARKASIGKITSEVCLRTYFRHPHEMAETGERWELQAVNMLMHEIDNRLAEAVADMFDEKNAA